VSAAVQLSLIRTSRTSCCPPQIGLPDCLPGCELAPALAFDYENLLPPTRRRCAAWAPLALSIGFPDPNSGLPRSRSAGLAIRPDLRRVVHRRFAVFAGHFNSRCGPESPDEPTVDQARVLRCHRRPRRQVDGGDPSPRGDDALPALGHHARLHTRTRSFLTCRSATSRSNTSNVGSDMMNVCDPRRWRRGSPGWPRTA